MKTRPVATTVALLCATFLSSMDVTVVGTAMPRIAGQLGGLELYPWVFSVFMPSILRLSSSGSAS